ncbi:MAG: sulfotransferase [Pirellulales bacterium]
MMRMLSAGGMPVLVDGERGADEDNPGGYYELEQVKRTRQDSSWLAQAPGKAVKVIYLLLSDLPAAYHYRVLFMSRRLDEVMASQRLMLARRGIEPDDDQDEQRLAGLLSGHAEQIKVRLMKLPNFKLLDVSYNALLADPRQSAEAVQNFLGVELDLARMTSVVDPALYRQRG